MEDARRKNQWTWRQINKNYPNLSTERKNEQSVSDMKNNAK